MPTYTRTEQCYMKGGISCTLYQKCCRLTSSLVSAPMSSKVKCDKSAVVPLNDLNAIKVGGMKHFLLGGGGSPAGFREVG